MWFTVLTMIWLLSISVSDIRKRSVPVWMLAPGGVLAGIMFVSQQGAAGDVPGILPGVILLVTAFITKKAGYGDGIVMLFLGIMSGGGESLLIFAAGLCFAAIFSLILLGLRKAGRNTRIPFLPFLAAAWLIVAVF